MGNDHRTAPAAGVWKILVDNWESFGLFAPPFATFFAKNQKIGQKTIGIREKMGYNSME
jgi:hypothetical protein